jgi:small subunit ribosomal protein S14
MLRLLKKDYQRRQLFFHYEKKKLLLKAIFSNTQIPLEIRLKAQFLLAQLPRDANKIRIRNRSFQNGKARAIFQNYGENRITFRNQVEKG